MKKLLLKKRCGSSGFKGIGGRENVIVCGELLHSFGLTENAQ